MNFVRRALRLLAAQWTWLKWGLALAILAWLFHQHRDGLSRLDWRQMAWPWLVAALGVSAAATVLTFLRWHLLVRALDLPFCVHDAVRLGMIGNVFNYIAPGAVGGDLVKGSLMAREQPGRRVVAVATVLLDRVVGMVGLLLVGAAAVVLPTPLRDRPDFAPIRWGLWIGSGIALAGIAVALHPALTRLPGLARLVRIRGIGPAVADLLNAVRLYQARPRVLVAAVAMSCVSHTGILLAFFLCALALPVAMHVPGFVLHAQFVPAAELFSVLIPLPAGVGALEGAIAWFYEAAGSAAEAGLLAAIVYRGVTIVVAVSGAGWYLANRRDVRQAVSEIGQREPSADPPEESASSDKSLVRASPPRNA